MVKKIIFFLIFQLWLPFAFAANPPVVYHSDVISGPNTGGIGSNGTIITIWGNNFNDTQGAGIVDLNGVNASAYHFWNDTQISFAINASHSTGYITVTTPDGTSTDTDLAYFTVRSGNIYFTSPSGSDSTGDGSYENPWSGVDYTENQMSCGDIAYFMDGLTFNWQTAYSSVWVINALNCGESDQVAFVAFPEAEVTIGSTSVNRGIYPYGGAGGSGYVFSKLKIRGQEFCIKNLGRNYWRVIGCDFYAPEWNGQSGVIEWWGEHPVIYSNYFHDCCDEALSSGFVNKERHVIYLNQHGGLGTYRYNYEVRWNRFEDNYCSRGIQFYSGHSNNGGFIDGDTYVTDNIMINNAGDCYHSGDRHIGNITYANNIGVNCGFWTGPEQAYRNFLKHCFHMGPGQAEANINMTNNVCYGESAHYYGSMQYETGMIQWSGAGTLTMKNNIFYSTNSDNTSYMGSSSATPDTQGGNNDFYGAGSAPAWDYSNVTDNPLFINPGGNNFRLQNSSTMRDAGLDTTGLAPRDKDGYLRPFNGTVDIGAYEWNNGTTAASLLSISTSSLPNAELNVSYSQAVSATGGTVPYEWAMQTGSLPSGLSLNNTTGTISGTPDTAEDNQTFTVNVTDAESETDSQELTINVVTTSSPQITTTTLPAGTIGSFYNQTISATGGVEPYEYAVESGSLPANITMNTTTGVVSGWPNETGTSTPTINVTDSENATDNQAYSIAISDPSASSMISFDAASNNGDANTTSLVWNHTVGNDDNRILFVGLVSEHINASVAIDSIKFNDEGMTLVASQSIWGGNNTAWLYYLVNASVGTHTINATMNVTGVLGGMAVSLLGVNTTDPLGGNVTDSGYGSIASVSAGAAAGQWLVDVACNIGSGNDMIADSGQTERAETGEIGLRGNMGTRFLAVNTSYTNDWILETQWWGTIGVLVNPAEAQGEQWMNTTGVSMIGIRR